VAFELIVPVYDPGRPTGTVAQRQKAFLGWASGQFRAGDFLRAALETTEQFTGVELHDEQVGRGSVVASFPSGFRADGPLVRTESFTFGGRRFVLRYAPRLGNSILGERTIPGPLMLGTGVALSILLGSLLWLLAQVGVLYQRVGRLARTDGRGPAARGGRGLGGPAAQDRPAGPLRRGGVRRGAAQLRAGQRHGDRRAAADRADRGHLLHRRRHLGHPRGGGELVARADRALYAAKEGGRDRACADRIAGAGSAAPAPTR
jgi:hypothetical protein